MESIVGKKSRLYWMGLAMVWIVFFHWLNPIIENESIPQTLRVWISRVSGSGYLGVDIFLFLSSYGLCHSFSKNNFGVYLYRRLIRIFPLFLIFIVPYLYFIADYTVPYDFAKVTFLHISGLSIFMPNSYAWYLPATIFIYWSFPIWFYLVRKFMSYSPFALLLLLVIMLFLTQLTIPYVFWLMNNRFIMIVLGIATYFALNNRNFGLDEKNIALFLFAPLLIAIVFARTKVEIVGMSIPFIFYNIDKYNCQRMFNHIFSRIGKYTLEIYLAQCVGIEWFTPPPDYIVVTD